MENKIICTDKLLRVIKTLRSPEGCSWDRVQTPQTLQKHLAEEVIELQQAIDNDDTENICEEIGDVLCVLVMLTEIYSEKQLFSYDDCITNIHDKLVRRHPHVFSEKADLSVAEIDIQWEQIKNDERKGNY